MNHVSQMVVALLMLTQSFLLAGCSKQIQYPAPESAIVWGEALSGLRCAINVDRSSVSKSDNSLVVTVRVQNFSDDKIEFKSIPAFKMGGCWCPVDLTGKHLPANERALISLGPGESVGFEADISKLAWERSGSSLWPNREFHRVVPSGIHELQLQFELLGSAEHQWLRSNPVTITIGG